MIDGLLRRLRPEYEVFAANDGASALRLLEQQGEMHVIVSDMRMPGMNGAALLLRDLQVYPDMVRVLLTVRTDLQSAIAAVNEGTAAGPVRAGCELALEFVQRAALARRAAPTHRQRGVEHRVVDGRRVVRSAEVFTAQAPQEAQGPKFEESMAVQMKPAPRRLLAHQAESQPVLDQLHAFMTEQLEHSGSSPTGVSARRMTTCSSAGETDTDRAAARAPVDNNFV
jgi:DNA-binding NtrC family response regulator